MTPSPLTKTTKPLRRTTCPRSNIYVGLPAVIALTLALLLRPLDIPILVSDGLGLLANMVAPLIMLSVGLLWLRPVFRRRTAPRRRMFA